MAKKIAKVVHILSDMKIVINMGSTEGVMEGERYFIYCLGDEIMDGNTSLGRVEIEKGIGVVTHVQETMATLESDKYIENESFTEVITGDNSLDRLSYLGFGYREKKIIHPNKKKLKFDDVKVGDLAREIKY